MLPHDRKRPNPPAPSQLQKKRRYHDIDLRRMFRDGEIQKDGSGYYMYEVELNPKGIPHDHRKVYFNNTFSQLESMIYGRYEESKEVTEAITKAKSKKEKLSWFRRLMQLDYELIFLHAVYEGGSGYPFLSVYQTKQILEEKLSLGIVGDVLEKAEATPLDSQERMPQLLGRTYTPKQLASNEAPGFFQRFKRDDVYFYTIPYGANREKR
ncbi:hypothetical protein [Alkalicoccus luteus]|uniref:Uncharacterized protein n=1 Tax=Alkalicoccus luteus TaxID=1237094 RepID=A0A969PTH1_9BACI|nr:hypothetical protein [Alkalicoccus luteus]NJP38086.1 hypothetical protein [Alkalicoccus luteus]